MPARGRGNPATDRAQKPLRRPGLSPVECKDDITAVVKNLVESITSIKSPDDIQVSKVAMDLRASIVKNEDLQYCVTELCNIGLDDCLRSAIVAKVFGIISQHQVGECKILTLLLTRVQKEYKNKDELVKDDRARFVTSGLFLGEVFHHVRSEKGTPYMVLVEPVLKYLDMIIEPHLNQDLRDTIDEDMSVVSKQLLQSGVFLHESNASGILKIVQDVTEVLCRRQLNVSTRVNLLTALAELWPLLSSLYNARTIHAQLANRLEVALKI
ncbi:hypothetical protein SK128_013052 [Halocaridina rubra]|uniref:Uncharacterized protein n=1 Tax=Halocaridina rubra TaxID=373956 RepID=A0AAN9A0Q1_HALRR